MAATFVQAFANEYGGGNYNQFIMQASADFTADNTLVGSFVYYANGNVPSESDITSITDGTNTYSIIDYLYDTGTGSGVVLFLGECIGRVDQVFVNFASSNFSYMRGSTHEIAGASTTADAYSIDAHHSIGSTTVETGSITPTQDGDYFYASILQNGSGFGSTTVASPFTIKTAYSDNSIYDAEYVQTTGAALYATFTVSNSGGGINPDTCIIAVKAAGGAETATASLAVTLGDFTLAGTVKVPSTAVLSETFADFILAGTALVSAQAHLAEAFADFTLAGTAIVSAQAALTETFADFTLSGTAKVPGAASLSETFADFTLAGTALISSQAHLAEAFADFTLVGTATAPSVATLSETFTDFVLAGTALVSAQAALAEAFADFTLAGTAQGSIPSAVLSKAFGDFVLTGSALVSAQAALSETFADFTATATAAVPSTAVLSETFADFTLVGTALVSAQASLNEAFADFVLVGTAIAGGIAAGTLAETFDNFVLAGSAVSLGTVQQQPIMPPSAFHGGGAVNVSDPGFLSDPAPQLVDPIFNMAAQNVQEARDINSFPNRLKRAFAIGKAIWESTKK